MEHEFEHIDAGSRVLSVGAGGKINERLLEAAGRSGFSVTQLDIDSERSPDIEADLCEWCDEEAYDVVVMSEVLEHLHDPQAALANVRRSLRDEGKLVLTVPFLFPIHDEPYDYFRYTEHGLRMLF